MKAEIDEMGVLTIIAKNKLEAYALDKWWNDNINECTRQFKNEPPRCFSIDTDLPEITLFQRIKLRIQLFLYR